MDILVVILLAVALWGCRLSISGHDDYLGREQTGAVKGIFAVLILFAHMKGYIAPELLDGHSAVYLKLIGVLGQLIVVMFLFYSGFGIMEALKRNRRKYTDTFLHHRLLRVWVMFASAVVLFMVLNLVLGREYPLHVNLLALTGWTDVGNSNWFMFDIMVLYLLTYLSLLAADRQGLRLTHVVASVYALTLLLMFVLMKVGKWPYWYDTILAYPTGMLYSVYKPQTDRLLRGRNWLIAFVSFGSAFGLCYALGHNRHLPEVVQTLSHILSTSLFGIVVVIITMKLKLHNRALHWLGVNAFAIYILQRLAMITCTHFGLNDSPLLFSVVVIPATLLIAAIYTAAFNRIKF